jgi:DNA helicase-2/ATP-dependent DNA helicase PcrA
LPITGPQIAAAVTLQQAAARDPSQQVLLIAGPGTGKSSSIEERVRWVLEQGAPPAGVFVISFTRASARDLRDRVRAYCTREGQAGADQVSVTTLHSLALRVLRQAGLLAAYPVDPLVLDNWETENVFDAEFGEANGIASITRRQEIQRHHEAYWSTSTWDPPNYVPPNPPITDAERQMFATFHSRRTQTYACVLPGEMVQQCVTRMAAGTLEPVGLLHIRHLIVDEFQDLNPLDLEFVDGLLRQGVYTFAAGDDDQSIYSFRYASPIGIQTFTVRYPAAGAHNLVYVFRSTPSVLQSAESLITANPAPNRLLKHHVSLYVASTPPVSGIVHRWRFSGGYAEARAIARSCRALIDAGVPAREILILLSNKRALLPPLRQQFEQAQVPYEAPRSESFVDSPPGRMVLAIVRVVADTNDYVAHRLLLGIPKGVGVGTCNAIAEAVVANNLNFRALFYDPLPNGIFTARCSNALQAASATCAQIHDWQSADTLALRRQEIGAILEHSLGQDALEAWLDYSSGLPNDMNLEEARNFLWADTDEQQARVLESVYERLEQEPPENLLPPKVRIMTMHGVKGLSGQVVFVPGLEDAIIPGPWRAPYPGLVLEAARLLYVSITRARAACVLSLATRRVVYGKTINTAASRFTANLNGPFLNRAAELTVDEAQQIRAQCQLL